MKRIFRRVKSAGLTVFFVACCACSIYAGATVSDANQLADDAVGAKVATYLSSRYAETSSSCNGNAGMPIFLCSGITLRGTQYSPNYRSWAPNPNSAKGDGVSFSFLRQDSKFSKLAAGYTHGFITYPLVYNPSVVIDLEVLCGFPLNAVTDSRSDRGCGPSRAYPNDSGPCQAQGITDSTAWLKHYRSAMGASPQLHQCGFTLVTGTPNSAAIFMQMLDAMRQLGQESFNENNELIIQSWTAEPNKVGIEAFFYLGNSDGLADSQKEQMDFYKATGAWRPVIRMTLPATSTDSARFEYDRCDQGKL
jgi:hypothetical protein